MIHLFHGEKIKQMNYYKQARDLNEILRILLNYGDELNESSQKNTEQAFEFRKNEEAPAPSRQSGDQETEEPQNFIKSVLEMSRLTSSPNSSSYVKRHVGTYCMKVG